MGGAFNKMDFNSPNQGGGFGQGGPRGGNFGQGNTQNSNNIAYNLVNGMQGLMKPQGGQGGFGGNPYQ